MDRIKIVSNINPYALAEGLTDKKIDWNKVSDPKAALEMIFGIPADRIFAPESPLVSPNAALDEDDNLHMLDDAAAKVRLETYLKESGSCAPRAMPADTPAAAPPASFEKISHLLFPDAAAADAPCGTPAPTAESEGEQVGDTEMWEPDFMVYADKGSFFVDAPEYNDPIQGNLGDCYLIAAMTSIAWSREYAIRNQMCYNNFSESTPEEMNALHLMRFYDRAKENWVQFYIDEYLPVYRNNMGHLIYARSKDPGEIWPGMIEHAYAMWKTDNYRYTNVKPCYPKIAGGNPGIAAQELLGGKLSFYRANSQNKWKIWNAIVQSCSSFTHGSGSTYLHSGKTIHPVTACTEHHPVQRYVDAGCVAGHAYSVLGFLRENDRYYVILRNPWGRHPMTRYVRDGRWEFSHYGGYLELGQDGIFAMDLDDFVIAFSEVETLR